MTETEAPEGYRPVETLADSHMGLICETCGSVVARRTAELHTRWHRSQRASQIIGPGLFS